MERIRFSLYSVWLQTGRPEFDPRQRQWIFPSQSHIATDIQTTDLSSFRASSGTHDQILIKDFSSSLCVQISSEAYPASCTMGTGSPFPGVKRGRGVTLTTYHYIVPRSKMSRSYISCPPWHMHGVAGQLYFKDWDIAPCSFVWGDRRFRGAYCLHHQGDELFLTLMEAVRTSETSVYSESTLRYIPEGSNLHTRCHKNLKSHGFLYFVRFSLLL
jgi:hypothetical protein